MKLPENEIKPQRLEKGFIIERNNSREIIIPKPMRKVIIIINEVSRTI